MSRLFPRVPRGKQAVVAAAALLAGCGGGTTEELREVAGSGYVFEGSTDLEVTRSGRTLTGEVDRHVVSVTTFRLARPYRPELWTSVVPELDRVATELAAKLGGRVVARETRPVAGRRARLYRVEGARDDTRLVAFVLRGASEYQLLCRWPGDEDASGPCDDLIATFRLT